MSISEPFRVPTAFEAARQAAAGTLHWRKVEVSIPTRFRASCFQGKLRGRTRTFHWRKPAASNSEPSRVPTAFQAVRGANPSGFHIGDDGRNRTDA